MITEKMRIIELIKKCSMQRAVIFPQSDIITFARNKKICTLYELTENPQKHHHPYSIQHSLFLPLHVARLSTRSLAYHTTKHRHTFFLLRRCHEVALFVVSSPLYLSVFRAQPTQFLWT